VRRNYRRPASYVGAWCTVECADTATIAHLKVEGLARPRPRTALQVIPSYLRLLRGGIALTSARIPEAELRVAVGPSAVRLAITAAISSKVSGTGSGAAFRSNRLPP